MKNSTLISTLKNIELWPKSKRLRILELILLLLLIGTAGYAGAHKTDEPTTNPAPVVTGVTKTTSPSTQAEAPAPVITPVVAAVAAVAAVVPPVTTTTTTDTTGGQGGAEAPVVLPSGINGLTEYPGFCIIPGMPGFCIPATPKANANFSVQLNGSKSVPISVTSDEAGAFTLDLDPGDYTIVPAPEAFYSYFSIPVTVDSGQYTTINVTYTQDPSTVVVPPPAPAPVLPFPFQS